MARSSHKNLRRHNDGANINPATYTSNFSLGYDEVGGVYVASSSDGSIVTGTLPKIEQGIGARSVFRLGSDDVAVITGSSASALFKEGLGVGSASGTSFKFIAGNTGDSCEIFNDGKNYVVTWQSASGSFV